MIKDDALKAARQPAPAWTEDPATTPQVNYIKGLVESRDIDAATLLDIKAKVKAGLKKGDAGLIINDLKNRPVKKGQDDRSKNNPTILDIPVGRYCVQTGEDSEDLSFYRVKEHRGQGRRAKTWKMLFRIAGPNEYILRDSEIKVVVKLIVRFGIGNAAALYGFKVGKCSVCHKRITNRVSRELGIGPVCGGRVYTDWHSRVEAARANLREQGFDPDENVGDNE